MDLLFVFITSLFITMVLIPTLLKSPLGAQFIDLPNARKVHTVSIPRIGGLAIVIGALFSILLWSELNQFVISYLLGALVLFAFGVWDDISDLDYKFKFLGQILAILIIVIFGDVKISHLPFLPPWELINNFIAIPLTIFFLLGITNAINLSDGLDGLAGGTTLLTLGIITVLAYLADGFGVILIVLAIIGSIMGFLRFNTYPAQIFMGDSGSQFLGYSAGALAVFVTQNTNTALSAALPLLILGLPILDTLTVMMQRIYEGRSPFKPDKNHLHHKLLNLNFDHHEAVFCIYIIQSLLIVSAYFLRYQSDFIIIGFYLFFCLSVITFFRVADIKKWQIHAKIDPDRTHIITRYIKWFQNRERLSKWSFMLVVTTLPIYLLAIVITENSVSSDIGILALILLSGLLAVRVLLPVRRDVVSWLERASGYFAISIFVYMEEITQTAPPVLDFLLNILLLLIALGVAIYISYMHEREFRVTPLDYLVVFVAVTLPLLPVSNIYDINIGVAIMKSILLFYSMEIIISQSGKDAKISRFLLYCALLTIGLKSMIFT